jgi:hypothetical protein
VNKQFEGNEDWVKRDEGRIPSKGARAAERASAGLGTSDEEQYLIEQPSPSPAALAKATPKPAPRPSKP